MLTKEAIGEDLHLKNVTARFISLMCGSFTGDDEVSLVTLEDLASKLPPFQFGQVVLDDVTDVQEL